ncbi:hypothetical protein Cgig2_024399 [Carnegiea gigantea]|uniref:Uncharacterized protein n=1 Tax=Carnegiea gigantea TaxID=171969 RepID=A0A9Q1GPG6_9CARY|nr:hypothetical protein Cgig2_024399 [Carnegiea gigantea]
MHNIGERSKSGIAKRIRRSPRRYPLAKQISLYFNPATALRIGKRIMGNVYTSYKWSRKATTHISKEQEAEEIGGSRVEVENVTTRVLAVVPVAAGCGQDQEPIGIHSTKGRSEEEQVGNIENDTEPTTTSDNTPTVEAGEASISQVQIIPFPVNFTYMLRSTSHFAVCSVSPTLYHVLFLSRDCNREDMRT